MYQNAKRTCKAIVFAHQTYCFVAFLLPLPSPSSFRKLPNDDQADVADSCSGYNGDVDEESDKKVAKK